MFGKNEVSSSFNASGDVLLIKELFYTIQGEGPDSGKAAIFLRLAKCNLRCWFCDTDFETDLQDWPLRDLCEKIGKMSKLHHCSFVVITGGEPLLQNIVPLVKLLNALGIKVSVETAGTKYYPELAEVFDAACSQGNLIVCSPKTPEINGRLERIVGAWKYVIKAGETHMGFPIGSTQMQGRTTNTFIPVRIDVPIWVQPMDEQDDALNAANLAECVRIVMTDPSIRLGVQIHKMAGLR